MIKILKYICLIALCATVSCKNDKYTIGTLEVVDYKPISNYHFNFKKNITVDEVVKQLKEKAGVNIISCLRGVNYDSQIVNLPKNLSTMEVLVHIANQLQINFSDLFCVAPSFYSWHVKKQESSVRNFFKNDIKTSFIFDEFNDFRLSILVDWRQFKIKKIKDIKISQNNKSISLSSDKADGSYSYKENINEVIWWNIGEIFEPNKDFLISFDLELIKQNVHGYKFKFLPHTKQYTKNKKNLVGTLLKEIDDNGNIWGVAVLSDFENYFSKSERNLVFKTYRGKIKPSKKYEELKTYYPEIIGVYYLDKNKKLQQCSFYSGNGAFNAGVKWQMHNNGSEEVEYLVLVSVPLRKKIMKSIMFEVNSPK